MTSAHCSAELPQSTRYQVVNFADLESAQFDAEAYSRMKFGDDKAARMFGRQLAEGFFNEHSGALLANRCLMIPSPYNFVPNAATVMTGHLINRLNELVVEASGDHVEYATIPRKVSYINDYGFLPKEQRRALIDNDQFYLNREYMKDRLLIFVDDVRITGTHEDKIVEMMQKHQLTNKAFFLYYAQYTGEDPKIESQINFAGIKSLKDYGDIIDQPHNHLIVRPIKFLLGQPTRDFVEFIRARGHEFCERLHHAALNEGYYKIPSYQENFQALRSLCPA